MIDLWHDWAILVIQLSFAAFVLPMAIKGPYPPLSTSIPTTVGLIALGAIMGDLGLWLAASSLFISATVWGIAVGNRMGEGRSTTGGTNA